MKKYIIGFLAVFFQLAQFVFTTAASPDYGDMALGAFISGLVAFLLYLWLFFLLKKSKSILLKFGMASSAALGLVGLVSYFDIRGYFG
ncbi:MAG: hypothetical protein OEZ51_00330 [Nitrospinota bacterium]|nr:hypothetical protein [Nitrospinota bacterium]